MASHSSNLFHNLKKEELEELNARIGSPSTEEFLNHKCPLPNIARPGYITHSTNFPPFYLLKQVLQSKGETMSMLATKEDIMKSITTEELDSIAKNLENYDLTTKRLNDFAQETLKNQIINYAKLQNATKASIDSLQKIIELENQSLHEIQKFSSQ